MVCRSSAKRRSSWARYSARVCGAPAPALNSLLSRSPVPGGEIGESPPGLGCETDGDGGDDRCQERVGPDQGRIRMRGRGMMALPADSVGRPPGSHRQVGPNGPGDGHVRPVPGLPLGLISTWAGLTRNNGRAV